MKVKNTLKKVGAVAGSALMVGMTMGAAQSLATFPQPFVDDNGNVASQIVVGSQGKVADVVGAVNLAASLGQSAVQTETKTKTVSGGGGFGWSAADGATLDTRNDNLYLGDNIDGVRSTLTANDLDVLADSTFLDANSKSTDVEYFVDPGTQAVQFTKADSNEDPVLNVNNPSDVDASTYLLQMRTDFGSDVDFTLPKNQDQDLELFGNTYTVSQDSSPDNLILFGSSQTLSLDAGQSGTVTVNGNEHKITLVAVNVGGAAYKVDDGTTKQKKSGSTFTLEGETVRIDDTVDLKDDSGSAAFKVGSEELTLTHGDQIQDSDGDDIDGTWVTASSTNMSNPGTINLFLGSEDDEHEWVAADESFSHSLFGNVQFHFGGLLPDAGEGAGDNVGEVMFSTTGDDTATVDLTDDGGNDGTIEFVHDSDPTNVATSLEDDDGDNIVVTEGAPVDEDQYVAADAGDFAHLWEVTDISVDETSDISSGDKATITLRDVVTTNKVEVTLDPTEGDGDSLGDGNAPGADHYAGTDTIDGVTYFFELEGEDNTAIQSGDEDGTASQVLDFRMAWGDGVSESDVTDTDVAIPTGGTGAGTTTLFAPLDTESGAAVGFATGTGDLNSGLDTSDAVDDTDQSVTLELPSTQSTDAKTVDVTVIDDGTGGNAELQIDSGAETTGTVTADTQLDYMVGQTVYQFDLVGVNTASTTVQVSVDADQDASNDDANPAGPSSLVIEPEDDGDLEDSFLVTPGTDITDEQVDVGGTNGAIAYTGSMADGAGGTTSGYNGITLESNDNEDVGYSTFGTHTIQNTDGQGSFTLHVPDGQAVAGAAFTSAGGSLSAGGGTSTTVEYTDVTGMGSLPNMARLDSEVTESIRSNNHLILVGGPAVNTLVSTLMDQDKMTFSDDLQGASSGAQISLVEDAFVDGKHALVVAGVAGDDTRAAAKYLGDYADHETKLSNANGSLVLTESDYPSTY